MTHSFDLKKGTLAVDYKSYIGKQDIVYNRPIWNTGDSAMVGNGKIGASVWNTDGLNLQVTAVDASEHSCLSSGLVTLETQPPLVVEGEFSQRMNLFDASVETTFSSKVKTTIFGDINSEVLGILVEDNRENVTSVTVTLDIWDTSKLEYKRLWVELDEIEKWREVEILCTEQLVALSRGEDTSNGFGYSLGVTVDGAEFKTRKTGEHTLTISVEPTKRFTIWIANPTKVNDSQKSMFDNADQLLQAVKRTGTEAVLEKSKDFWHEFWEKSFIQFTNQTESGDYIENTWYDSIYMIALASKAQFPCHFNNGIFKWDGDEHTRWSAYYTYFNQRAINNHWLTSNHAEMVRPHIDFFFKLMPFLIQETKRVYNGMDGMKVQESLRWNGTRMSDESLNYTGRIFTDNLETSLLMYMYSEYTNDKDYLRSAVYPFMKQSVLFYSSRLSYDGTYYNMLDSNSLEMYWDVKNPITDLTAIQVVFPLAVEIGRLFNEDEKILERWQHILDHISPLEIAETEKGTYKYLPCASPVPKYRNLQNPEMEMIWPYGATGIDADDYAIAVETWGNRAFDYTIWSPDAAAAARLGMGDVAFNGIVTMCQKHQIRASGFHDDGNGAFESNGLVTCAINESLLQSYNDKIRVFPALPSDPSFIAKFTLLAKGGFLVSSEYEESTVKYVGIKSLYGNHMTIVNPWKNELVQITRASDAKILLQTTADLIKTGTYQDEIYILEKVETSFSSMKFERVTGKINEKSKSLNGVVTLGYN